MLNAEIIITLSDAPMSEPESANVSDVSRRFLQSPNLVLVSKRTSTTKIKGRTKNEAYKWMYSCERVSFSRNGGLNWPLHVLFRNICRWRMDVLVRNGTEWGISNARSTDTDYIFNKIWHRCSVPDWRKSPNHLLVGPKHQKRRAKQLFYVR